MSGFIYLPSDKCIKDFSITARYMDTEGAERSSQSTPFDLPTLHLPYGFVATLQANGSVQLRWECKDKNWADISTDDIWDIQRNTSGDSSSEGLWQSTAMVIGSCRAYFKINGISRARSCILNFGESVTTTIHNTPFTNEAGAWFSLDGRRLNSKPTMSGVYINNGRKVVVK